MLLIQKSGAPTAADRTPIPPGSMAYPPCSCPRCRVKPLDEPALATRTNQQNSMDQQAEKVRK
ncbi:hypothetical protein AB0I84_32920 [Streptomyces spectabilis]|uniref:hypothetical protein n=1 Tax=Streptomyces spectabilis TaxID=68270 RepID=UPI0033CCC4AE